jgi:hypothetical protein
MFSWQISVVGGDGIFDLLERMELCVKNREMTNNYLVCNDGLAVFTTDLGSSAPLPRIFS